MWIVTQIVAMLAISAKQTVYRIYELGWIPVLLVAGLLIVIEASLWHSVNTAPSFFKVWFLGTSLLALFGFGLSFLYFNEVPTIWNLMGAGLAIGGAVLLVIK